MKKILELMKKNYPGNTVLFIYDDESGRLLKDGSKDSYDYDGNVYFDFSSLDDLTVKLSNPPAEVVYEDALKSLEVDEEDEFPF